MKITGRLGDSCPNGVDCDRVYDTDGDDVLVQGERLVTDPAVRAEVGVPDHELLLQVSRTALYPPQLTPTELGQWIFDRFTREVVRIEARSSYQAGSDSEEGKRAWQATLDGLLEQGRVWRVVHLLRGEPTDYELYEFRTYAEHVEHGEDIRVLAVPQGQEADLDGVPDFFVIDRRHVVRSIYDTAGALLGGQVVSGPDAAVYRSLALTLYTQGVDLRSWRAAHPEYRGGMAA